MEELRDAWVYLSPDHKRFLEKNIKNIKINKLKNYKINMMR
jgi:hypothetical protein